MAENNEVVTVDTNFPSNSSSSASKEVERNTTPIIPKVNAEDRAIKKETLFGKFLNAAGDTLKYTLDEIIAPNLRRMVYDGITTVAGRSILGESRPRRRNDYYDDYDPIPYNSYYSRPRTYSYDDRRSDYAPRLQRNRNELPPLLFRAKSNAQDFLDNLYSALDKYHEITVNNVYDSYGNPDYLREIDYTWNGYGWSDEPNRDLRGASVRECRDGWYVMLPKPVALDR